MDNLFIITFKIKKKGVATCLIQFTDTLCSKLI